MEKLVRDRIPEIIMAKGEPCVTRIAESDKEYEDFLKKKLSEEIDEFYAAGGIQQIEEMADIVEVIRAIQEHYKLPTSEVERVRKEKLQKRGGFTNKIIWKDIGDYYGKKTK